MRMKKNQLFVLFISLIFTSCQTLYTYRLPTENEQKRLPPDSTRWGYAGSTITSIPVVDGIGNIFRLAVTPKTKIEVKSIYGDLYRFYIQSIIITGDESILGTKLWQGYDLLSHSQRTIQVHEVSQMTILSDDKAVAPIAIR